MTLLSRAIEARTNLENPQVPLTSTALVDWLSQGARSKAGVSVNEDNALTISAFWRAASLISGTAAGLPLDAYTTGTFKKVNAPILVKPNDSMTAFEFKEAIFLSIELWGNAYVFKQRNGSGRVVSLMPINPSWVKVGKVETDSETARLLPSGKLFEVTYPNGRKQTFTEVEILHIPGMGYDGVCGLAPIRYARESLGTALATEQYGARFFGSGSLMSGILQTEQRLDQPAADALKKRWMDRIAGIGRAHEIAVLDAGAKFQPISISPEDAQFLESRRFHVTEVARWTGVPPHLLFETDKVTSWGTGLEQGTLGFLVFSLQSRLTRVEQRISREAIIDPNTSVRFAVNGLLRGDSAARSAYYSSGIQNGWLSPDEARAGEFMEPIADGSGSKYLTPMNMKPSDSSDTSADDNSDQGDNTDDADT